MTLESNPNYNTVTLVQYSGLLNIYSNIDVDADPARLALACLVTWSRGLAG